jgi:hypothetical protein
LPPGADFRRRALDRRFHDGRVLLHDLEGIDELGDEPAEGRPTRNPSPYELSTLTPTADLLS